MTKIKMLNDRIIFDGHADSRQECETITLMCDNLAKSKDFKTIRYESGYAEFEKVGKTEELKFVSEPMNCTINFDSHVTKVEVTNEYDETYTWTTSGQTFLINGNSYTTYIFTVTLENGFEINTVQATEAEQYEILSFSNNVSRKLSKPDRKFTADMTYGMLASGSCLLTDIVDQLHEDSKKVNSVERLTRHLNKGTSKQALLSYHLCELLDF